MSTVIYNCGLTSLPGKLAGLLVHMYNMHPLSESGNNDQDIAYYAQDLHTIITILQ